MSYIRRGIGSYAAATNEPFFPFAPNKPSGVGCDCGGTCGGCGDHSHGMGLFDSMDPTTWGAGEYTVLGVGGYVAVKLLGDAQKVGRKAKRAARSTAGKGGLGVLGLVALAGGAYYLWSKSQASTGVGDYMPQGYVNPQLLLSPQRDAAIRISLGWGGHV